MKIKNIIKIIILIITAILIFCFVMKNFFPAEWSFITPHKQGDFVRVGNMQLKHHASNPVLLDDGRVLFAGRKQSEYYDPKTRKFYLLDNGNLEIPNGSVATKLTDGCVLFIGGESKNGVTQQATFIFYPNTATFSRGPNMLTGRIQHSVILLNDGRIFVAGGINKNNKTTYLKTTELYNPKTNKFEQGPSLSVEIPYLSNIIQLKNGNNYVFGCIKGSDYICEQHIYEFANNSSILKYIDKLPCRSGDIYKLKSEEIITFCGVSDSYKSINKILIYNPKTNGIRGELLNLPNSFNAKTILLSDNTLLFIAISTGFATNYKIYKEAKIYNPKTNNLEVSSRGLNVYRTPMLKEVFLNDGNLLLAGGEWRSSKHSSAEIYMFNDKIEK